MMRHFPSNLPLYLTAAMLLLTAPQLAAQDRADRVEFVQPEREGATTTRTGLILTESPAKVVLRQMGGTRLEIPTETVVNIDYDDSPSTVVLMKGAERAGRLEQALEYCERALRELKPTDRLPRAQLRFRRAELRSRLDDATPAQRLELWREFLKEYPDGRQTLRAWEQLGAALLASGTALDEAVAGINGLRARFDEGTLPLRCDLALARLYLDQAETGSSEAAAVKMAVESAAQRLQPWLQDEAATARGDFRRLRVRALALSGKSQEALALLESTLKQAETSAEQAQLYFERGELRRRLSDWREARWDYLRVELLYPAEAELKPLLLERLAETFEKLGDSGRARDYRERWAAELRKR